jgi:hypothetical protein
MNEMISQEAISPVFLGSPPPPILPVEPEAQTIRCAECFNCKVFKETNRNGRYILKCRCIKRRWYTGKKEITCEPHKLSARRRDDCPDYESTSDDEQDKKRFIDELEDFLPIERHIFNPDGSYVDKTETMAWGENT